MKINSNMFEVLSARLCGLLETEAYSKNTVKRMNHTLQAMSCFMEAHHFKEYTPEIGERFVAYCISDLQICSSHISRAKNVTGKLNRLLQGLDVREVLLPDTSKKFALPQCFMDSLTAYLAYCAEKGNRQTTLRNKYLVCGNFLKHLCKLGCTEISDVTAEYVQSAFLALGSAIYWINVGPFLYFLFDNNLLKQNYSGLIQHRHNPMPQPTVYSTEELSCVENSFDLSSQSGIRNYVITLLMMRYGIRACDVAALNFDNIDFENNRLHFIQQKTGDLWEAELFSEVKTALKNYTKNVRPNVMVYPNVFISLVAPYAPISSNAVNRMISNQFERAKINIAGRKHGSRACRSSIASNMINDGVSTEVVRKVLGHGTKYALKHYARIDVESMRLCPLPVPEPTGLFAEMLSGKGGILRV
jgi:site-specific recombinase XerD